MKLCSYLSPPILPIQLLTEWSRCSFFSTDVHHRHHSWNILILNLAWRKQTCRNHVHYSYCAQLKSIQADYIVGFFLFGRVLDSLHADGARHQMKLEVLGHNAEESALICVGFLLELAIIYRRYLVGVVKHSKA